MLKKTIDHLLLGQDLTIEMAEESIKYLLQGQINDVQQAAFLTALKIKGETNLELAAFANVMRQMAKTINTHNIDVIDLAGTGGDGKSTFNVSTAVSFVIAGAGAKVVKHGNHGVSGPVGSTDVLEFLGIPSNIGVNEVEDCLLENGMVFLYAPNFQPAMANVAKVRRSLGFRTIFNLLGPLTNPASPKSQLMGIYDYEKAFDAASVLVKLGAQRVMIVNSEDGMDEISALAPTRVYEIIDGVANEYVINPKDYGFGSKKTSYTINSVEESAKIIESILQGEDGTAREMVLINAGAAFYVYGLCKNIKEGVDMAKESIDSGAAMGKLLQMKAWGEKTKKLALLGSKVS